MNDKTRAVIESGRPSGILEVDTAAKKEEFSTRGIGLSYYPYEDNVLLIGKMKSGKTYQANKLVGAVRKTNVLVLDSHGEYLDYPLRVEPSRPHTVEVVNRLVDTAYSYAKDKDGNRKLAYKVVVFDDIDLYVRYDRESQSLADIFIDGRHYKIGCLILAKRCVNLDKRVLQACKFIYVFKGTINSDYERIAEECSLDFMQAGEAKVMLDRDPNEHKFILIDNVAKTCRLLSDINMTAGL